ncbi:tetratricopeptide repeat protein [bacterium]|nr:tetratricopeptide repeat protein [bacterium]
MGKIPPFGRNDSAPHARAGVRALWVVLALGCSLPVAAVTARDNPLSDVEAHRRYQDEKLAAGQQSVLALEYSDLMEKNPDNAYAYLHYGRALDPSVDYAKAVEAFQRAADLNPGLFWARYSLGSLFLAAQQMAPAERELLEAERLAPTHPETQYNLAYLYMLLGKREESLRHARRAVQLAPDLAQARELLERLEGKRTGLRDSQRGWTLLVAAILLAVVINYALLRRRYRKYLSDNDAFEYAQRSVRRERHRPGTRRVPDRPADPREPSRR